MLTRVRIETFNPDLQDVQRELDELEAAVLKHELETVQLSPFRLPEDPAAAIAAAVAEFNKLGEGAVTRKMTEQVIRESADGDGWVARRVVRYDDGVYSEPLYPPSSESRYPRG